MGEYETLFLMQLLKWWCDKDIPDSNKDETLTMLKESNVEIDTESGCIWWIAGGGGTLAFMKHVLSLRTGEEEMNENECLTASLHGACNHARGDMARYLLNLLKSRGTIISLNSLLACVSKDHRSEACMLVLSLYGIDDGDSLQNTPYDLDMVL
jgi:hypothetical protein